MAGKASQLQARVNYGLKQRLRYKYEIASGKQGSLGRNSDCPSVVFTVRGISEPTTLFAIMFCVSVGNEGKQPCSRHRNWIIGDMVENDCGIATFSFDAHANETKFQLKRRSVDIRLGSCSSRGHLQRKEESETRELATRDEHFAKLNWLFNNKLTDFFQEENAADKSSTCRLALVLFDSNSGQVVAAESEPIAIKPVEQAVKLLTMNVCRVSDRRGLKAVLTFNGSRHSIKETELKLQITESSGSVNYINVRGILENVNEASDSVQLHVAFLDNCLVAALHGVNKHAAELEFQIGVLHRTDKSADFSRSARYCITAIDSTKVVKFAESFEADCERAVTLTSRNFIDLETLEKLIKQNADGRPDDLLKNSGKSQDAAQNQNFVDWYEEDEEYRDFKPKGDSWTDDLKVFEDISPLEMMSQYEFENELIIVNSFSNYN